MFFIGIDLAWSEKNSSGIAVIECQRDTARFICGTSDIQRNSDILDFILTQINDNPALVAIDASLIVNNETGERKAETQLKKMFAAYHAVPYPSNRNLYRRLYGGIRGEQISKMLGKKGFQHSPYITKFEESKKFFEVFPHSAMVVIFNLKEILKYKPKKNRSYYFRWQEFETYQSCLKSLEKRNPSLILPHDIINTNVRVLKGKALKRYEDLLDAIFCAYIAYYYWYEPGTCSVIGDLKDGYIVTPDLEKRY
jgi:predicted RNase H-like nuclease